MVKKGKPVTKLSSEDKWGKLTEDDFDRVSGKRDGIEGEGKLQERNGPDKEQVERKIDDWLKSLDQKEPKSETSKDHSEGSKKNE